MPSRLHSKRLSRQYRQSEEMAGRESAGSTAGEPARLSLPAGYPAPHFDRLLSATMHAARGVDFLVSTPLEAKTLQTRGYDGARAMSSLFALEKPHQPFSQFIERGALEFPAVILHGHHSDA
jgi:hypothetical protein